MFTSSRIKSCLECHTDFKVKAPTHLFCSRSCQVINWKRTNTTRYSNYRIEYKKSFSKSWKKWIQQLIYSKDRRHLSIDMLLQMLEKQEYRCVLSGIELTKIPGEKFTNISIDRINQARGYEIDNIRFVCSVVNTMRWLMTDEQLYDWCERISKEKTRKL
jgi:hypothetical protein